MNLKWLYSPTRWKDSFAPAFAILAAIETFFAISAISLDGVWGKYKWIIKLLLKYKHPDAVKNIGTHKAMCYYENGKYYWDYQAVKSALGQ